MRRFICLFCRVRAYIRFDPLFTPFCHINCPFLSKRRKTDIFYRRKTRRTRLAAGCTPIFRLLPPADVRHRGRQDTDAADQPARRTALASREKKLPRLVPRAEAFFHSMELPSTGSVMMSFVSGVSATTARASTIFPAGTEWVSHTPPPMMQSLPIRVCPPRIVAPE